MKDSNVKDSFEKNIKRLAYRYYILDWIGEHLEQDELAATIDLFAASYDPDDCGNGYAHIREYLDENGFSGKMWVCFDEFLDCEYQNEGYMGTILPVYLLMAYRKDRKLDGSQTYGEMLSKKITDFGLEKVGKFILSKANAEDLEEPQNRIHRCIAKEVACVFRDSTNTFYLEGAKQMLRAITGETIEVIISEAEKSE